VRAFVSFVFMFRTAGLRLAQLLHFSSAGFSLRYQNKPAQPRTFRQCAFVQRLSRSWLLAPQFAMMWQRHFRHKNRMAMYKCD
jgi:hypothetical protein